MKLHDRFPVEGTNPTIYVGKREYRDRNTREIRVSKKWYCEYRHEGIQRYEPLGTSNKSAAIKAVFRILQRLENGEDRVRKCRIELAEVIQRYLESKKGQNKAPKTLTKYEGQGKRFLEWAHQNDVRLASAMTAQRLWQFGASLDLDQETKADYLLFVKQVFKWALKEKLIQHNHIESEQIRKPKPKVQPCFQPEQVDLLLQNADEWERPVFASLAYTGMRVGEACELQWSDVHLDAGNHGVIHVQRGGSQGETKDHENRMIPIHPVLRGMLDQLPRVSDRVFNSPRTSKSSRTERPLTERFLLARIKRLCTKCGFPNPRQYKLHTFRHAFASALARQQVSYKHALALMGHSSSQILDLYITLYDQDREVAIGAIDYSPKRGAIQRVA